MARIEVKRTVLVEETYTYESNVGFPILGSMIDMAMENGETFSSLAVLIEEEINSLCEVDILYSFNSEHISKPQIISIKQV